MKISVHDLQKDEMVRVTQDNVIDLMRFWNEYTNVFQAVDDEKSFRTQSPLPHPMFNNILRTALDSDAGASVSQIVHGYKERNVPFVWRLWEHDTPADLGALLRENGGQPIDRSILMAIDLESFHPLTDPYPGLTIQKVRNKQDAFQYAFCTSKAFGIPADFIDAVSEVMGKQDQNITNYVGVIAGEPKAISTIFYSNDVAGIYNVGTLPEYQGKGVGLEMMTTTLLKAKLDGYKTAILHSTPAGIRLYEKLGFSRYGEMQQYLFA